MVRSMHGVIHGKTIELDQDPGLAPGQEIVVQVTVVPPQEKWGEGIRRSAGGWADYPEMDAIMAQIQEERQQERRSQEFI